VREINDLKLLAERAAGKREALAVKEKIVAAVEYRDGTIIDTVRQVL
jgi:citrate lyase subunit alpha/citrate CoA-transferase